jgi:cathepsin C
MKSYNNLSNNKYKEQSIGRDRDGHLETDYAVISKYINRELNEIDENSLPSNWDWRNIGGISYVPEPRKQGDCGSCYIFSIVSSLEARLRILTNNRDKTEFSRQFPVSCSFYTEGCDGGYPILVAKFFNEFEIVPESCFEYRAKNDKCSNVCDYKQNPLKYYVSKYEYLGGFYGATNEVEIMKELRARGPIPGNMTVPWSFSYYKSGIFSENSLKKNSGKLNKTTLLDKNLSWSSVDHSILLVGYGEENGVKYWIGMNTWGKNWGENGFFRILRGENDCNIETMGDAARIAFKQR